LNKFRKVQKMLEFFRKILGKMPAPQDPAAVPDHVAGLPDVEGDDEFSWMFPPSTMVDPAAWDKYWRDQMEHDVAGFSDLFCDDGEIIDVMRANGLKKVLCLGNGTSQEPRALAWAGFDVTALDLSPFATQVASGAAPPEELLEQLIGGRSPGLQGELEFVVGDLRDVTCCPGPFDVVIDRRTLQLYPDVDRSSAMHAVANRLASPGIFFSQSHDGGWRPPAPRRHACESWFRDAGWQFWGGNNNTPLTGQVAWLFTTTG
jgi:SAM-dependent methyltransferase